MQSQNTHTLIQGFDMEDDSWRVRSVSSGPSRVPFNIMTCKNNVCSLTCSSEEKSLHICTVRQITRQLFPRKLLSQKYVVMWRERGDGEKEEPGANDWQSFRSTLQVFAPFVAKKKIVTGS